MSLSVVARHDVHKLLAGRVAAQLVADQPVGARPHRAAGATELRQNEIASVSVKTLQSIACDSYKVNRETGAFILIDEANDTVAAGFIN